MPAFLRGIPERLFALDSRSLALFRVGLGLLVVIDASGRLGDTTALYGDAGAVPRAVVREFIGGRWLLSLHLLDGSALFAGGLLVIHALAGVCLVAGYRTRLATALAWVLTLSIQHRNPLVVNWGDSVLCLLLFWSLFLPLAERASIDRRGGTPARGFLGFGSVGFVFQLACIYSFSALLKTGASWSDGSAVAVALQNEMIARPLAAVALGYPELLTAITHAVRYFEAIAPLLLFVPLGVGPLRTALVLGFWGFHLGLLLLLDLGLFSFVCIVAWCALIPGTLWDRLGVGAGGAPDLLRKRQWLALACLGLVLVSNLGTLPERSIPAPLRAPLQLSGLTQKWGMFADPGRGDGWLVVLGRRADGAEEDLLWGGAPSWSTPTRLSELDLGWRWRIYHRGLWRRRPAVRQAYAVWLCRSENARRNDRAQLESVTIHLLKEAPPASGGSDRVDDVTIWDEPCAPSTPAAEATR